jgi:hypothetical protein
MDDRFTRMIFATAALAAVVGVLACPAGANRARQVQSAVAVVVPYVSHGIGVDKTQFSGQRSLPPATQIPYLSQGVGVDKSQFGAQSSPRLTGVHAALLDRRSPLSRVPEAAPAPTVSGGKDIDWTWFGAGAGMAALVAAGLVGILLTVRRRHTVGLP